MSSHLYTATSISFSKITLLHRQGFRKRLSSLVQANSHVMQHTSLRQTSLVRKQAEAPDHTQAEAAHPAVAMS